MKKIKLSTLTRLLEVKLKWKITILLLSLLVIGFITAYFLFLFQPPEKYPDLENVNLGVETSLLPALVWIAENKGYFPEQGLDVKIQEFDSGRMALRAMLDNETELDLVTVAQTPVMFNSFNRDDFGLIGMMVSSYKDVQVIARKDKRINTPADLKGKKIGLTKGSTGHLFLSLFLNNNHISFSEVELLDFKATELTQVLAEGKVDAISTWQPHIYNAEKLLAEKVITFSPNDIFREDFYFVTKKDFAQNNPELLKKFLKAIKKAEKFIEDNREEAIAIVSQRLKIERGFAALIWENFIFKLQLDQSIITTLEDEARWAITNNLTDKTKVPNYLNYIYLDALEEVKPEAVTIIR